MIVPVDCCCCSDYFDNTNYTFRPPGLIGKKLEALTKENCSWLVLHADIGEMVQSATYRGVAVSSLGEKGSQTRVGRLQTEMMTILDVEKVVDVVTNSAIAFLNTDLTKLKVSTSCSTSSSSQGLWRGSDMSILQEMGELCQTPSAGPPHGVTNNIFKYIFLKTQFQTNFCCKLRSLFKTF